MFKILLKCNSPVKLMWVLKYAYNDGFFFLFTIIVPLWDAVVLYFFVFFFCCCWWKCKKKTYFWHVTRDTWHVTRETWHVTRDTWHVICDTWHMAPATPGLLNITLSSKTRLEKKNSHQTISPDCKNCLGLRSKYVFFILQKLTSGIKLLLYRWCFSLSCLLWPACSMPYMKDIKHF